MTNKASLIESYTTETNETIIPASAIADKLTLVGRVISLMLDSEGYLMTPLMQLKKALMAPIYQDQAFIAVKDGKVIAFVSWAYLNKDAEDRLISGQGLEVTDWISGDNIWLVDVVSPYVNPKFLMNHAQKIGKLLGHKGKKIRFRRYNEETGEFEVREVGL